MEYERVVEPLACVPHVQEIKVHGLVQNPVPELAVSGGGLSYLRNRASPDVETVRVIGLKDDQVSPDLGAEVPDRYLGDIGDWAFWSIGAAPG